jgi:hypothetical protein
MSRTLTSVIVFAAATAVGCSQGSTSTRPSALPSPSAAPSPSIPSPTSTTTNAAASSNATATPMSSPNGVAGSMPAYYDAQLFTINFKELPPGGESATLAHNGSINTIYMSDGCMPSGQMFVSVLDAIQGDGFNPLWNEVQVVFNKSAPCQQFTSDTDILAAAAANTITLQKTDEVYRCSVIGKKK